MKNNDVLKKSIREKAQRSDRESGLVLSHRSITSPLFLRLLPDRGPGTPGPWDPGTPRPRHWNRDLCHTEDGLLP